MIILVIIIELHGATFLQKLHKIVIFIYTYAMKFISQLFKFVLFCNWTEEGVDTSARNEGWEEVVKEIWRELSPFSSSLILDL